jgi:hypothetical protein
VLRVEQRIDAPTFLIPGDPAPVHVVDSRGVPQPTYGELQDLGLLQPHRHRKSSLLDIDHRVDGVQGEVHENLLQLLWLHDHVRNALLDAPRVLYTVELPLVVQ